MTASVFSIPKVACQETDVPNSIASVNVEKDANLKCVKWGRHTATTDAKMECVRNWTLSVAALLMMQNVSDSSNTMTLVAMAVVAAVAAVAAVVGLAAAVEGLGAAVAAAVVEVTAVAEAAAAVEVAEAAAVVAAVVAEAVAEAAAAAVEVAEVVVAPPAGPRSLIGIPLQVTLQVAAQANRRSSNRLPFTSFQLWQLR